MFRPGDVVVRRDGGPEMVIERIQAPGLYQCAWTSFGTEFAFDHGGEFTDDELTLVRRRDEPKRVHWRGPPDKV